MPGAAVPEEQHHGENFASPVGRLFPSGCSSQVVEEPVPGGLLGYEDTLWVVSLCSLILRALVLGPVDVPA